MGNDDSELKHALEQHNGVMQEYESRGFTESLDNLLYRSWRMNLDAKNLEEAEKCKQRLLQEFPDSYWIDFLEIYSK